MALSVSLVLWQKRKKKAKNVVPVADTQQNLSKPFL
jgi:hypothetical protein